MPTEPSRTPEEELAISIDVVARTIWGEARGEAREGRIAVGCCIRNRVNLDLWNDNKPDWWGEGYVEVCKKPWQFTCWQAHDDAHAKNRARMLAATPGDPIFAECLEIAEDVILDRVDDPTGGATHYKTIVTPWPKPWGPEREPVAVIGRHHFFDLVKPLPKPAPTPERKPA